MSYIVAADMVNRYNVDILGQLASDYEKLNASEMDASPIMQAAMKTATGRVQAAIASADRYTFEQITNLLTPASDQYNENSAEYLKSLTCSVCWQILWARKPWNDATAQTRRQAEEGAEEALKLLRQGTDILALGSGSDRTLPTGIAPTSSATNYIYSQRARGRYFPQHPGQDRRY